MRGTAANPFGGAYTPDPLAQFLSRVVPWSTTTPPDSYVCVHANGGVGTHPFRWGGRAYGGYADQPELLNFVAYASERRQANTYYCLSAVADYDVAKSVGRKYRASLREGRKARLTKAFVLDLDVKAGSYVSQRDALRAGLAFLDSLGLEAGYIVNTGNGIHLLIVLDQAIEPHVWQPLAHKLVDAATKAGLYFDKGVSSNIVTLLRLPTGHNYKDPNNPKPCSILGTGPDTPLAKVEAALAGFEARPTPGVSAKSDTALDLSWLPARPPITNGPDFDRVSAELAKNRVVTSVQLLHDACPVVADSYARGGDGDREPLWFELAKLCHYTDGGRDFFHDLSCDDPRYDPEAVDAKYDTVRHLGWPSCNQIESTSPDASNICRTCPHYGKGLSPIHVSLGLKGTGTPNASGPAPAVQQPAPAPYVNGHSHQWVGQSTIILPPNMLADFGVEPASYIATANFERRVFRVPIYRIDLMEDKSLLKLTFLIDDGTRPGTKEVQIEYGWVHVKQTAAAKINGAGIGYDDYELMRRFMMSWVEQIRAQREALGNDRPGWLNTSFNFGGQLHEGGKVRRMSHPGDDMLPQGTLTGWKKAANSWVGRGCTELETIYAGSFAAPLIPFTAIDGVVLHAKSAATGTGKTTALKAGTSVWYSDKKLLHSATFNGVFDRVAEMNNLPVGFDEVAKLSARDRRSLGDQLLNFTSGVERLRLNRQSDPRQQRTSRTMVMTNANQSLIELCGAVDTNALAARVIEIDVSDNPISRSGVAMEDASTYVAGIRQNYGTAGMVVSEFLGSHYNDLQARVDAITRFIAKETRAEHGDRFWIAGAATIVVGAEMANKLGLVNFDVPKMLRFLISNVYRQRAQVIDLSVNADDPEVQLKRVRDFLNENSSNRIITDMVPGRGYNHNSSRCKVIYPPAHENIIIREYVARIGQTDLKMMVSEPKLKEWCDKRMYSYDQMRRVLTKAGVCVRSRNARSLDVGIAGQDLRIRPGGRVHVLEFDLHHPANVIFITEGA